MKILLISESLNAPGGWATYTKNLSLGLKELGHDVTIWSPEDCGILRQLPTPLDVLRFPLRMTGLRSALRHFAPDVIHITAEPYALLFTFLPRDILSRSILTIHGSYGVRLLRSPLSRMMMKRVLARLSACITVSEYTKARVGREITQRISARLAERFLKHAHVIYNAIRIPEEKRMHAKNPGEPKQILLIGPVKPRKGVLEAVEACALYRQTHTTPFALRIIGTQNDSAYSRTVEQRIVALHMQNEIRFEGVLPQDKLDAAYRSGDLLLLPARTTETTFEGFGLVYIEAAGYGIPSIGPDDSGAAEAIAEGRSGYRVHSEDAAAIAERMHWILDEHRITPETCRTWAQQFSIPAMAKAMTDLYGSLEGAAA